MRQNQSPTQRNPIKLKPMVIPPNMRRVPNQSTQTKSRPVQKQSRPDMTPRRVPAQSYTPPSRMQQSLPDDEDSSPPQEMSWDNDEETEGGGIMAQVPYDDSVEDYEERIPAKKHGLKNLFNRIEHGVKEVKDKVVEEKNRLEQDLENVAGEIEERVDKKKFGHNMKMAKNIAREAVNSTLSPDPRDLPPFQRKKKMYED